MCDRCERMAAVVEAVVEAVAEAAMRWRMAEPGARSEEANDLTKAVDALSPASEEKKPKWKPDWECAKHNTFGPSHLRCPMCKPSESQPRAVTHAWIAESDYAYCAFCGVVKNEEKPNKPCPGKPPRITTREVQPTEPCGECGGEGVIVHDTRRENNTPCPKCGGGIKAHRGRGLARGRV